MQNSSNLLFTLQYVQDLIQGRLKHHFEQKEERFKIPPLSLPTDDGSPFTRFIANFQLTTEEVIVVMLALIPDLHPNFFDNLIASFITKGSNFPEFGGVKGKNHRGLIPTGETALFVLAGNDIQRRIQVQQIFDANHLFQKENILYLEEMRMGEPRMSGRLILDKDYLDLFTAGYTPIPRMSSSFPAQHITTEMEWNDLVLNHQTTQQIKELEDWVKHNDTLMYSWGMHKKLKPGFRALFYGPPGTGKTLTATLLGKYTGKEVFRIDLSMVISKYIGETEKNLSSLFDKARNKNWILFFDEADAIFGKRTGVRDAHDKYANQEVSYLLQRIENYPGLAILASNFKANIDDAFLRRFNTIIYFPAPKAPERLRIWENAFPLNVKFAEDIDLLQVAQKYEMTGSNIMNVVQHTCLNVLANGTDTITYENLCKGIHKEYSKEGKMLS